MNVYESNNHDDNADINSGDEISVERNSGDEDSSDAISNHENSADIDSSYDISDHENSAGGDSGGDISDHENTVDRENGNDFRDHKNTADGDSGENIRDHEDSACANSRRNMRYEQVYNDRTQPGGNLLIGFTDHYIVQYICSTCVVRVLDKRGAEYGKMKRLVAKWQPVDIDSNRYLTESNML